MRKQRVILSVALFLSAGFALCYVMFFIVFSPGEVVSFGYHQLGIFKDDQNVIKMQKRMEEMSVEVVSVPLGELTYIITPIRMDEARLKEEKAVLDELQISYISKWISSDDVQVKRLLQKNDIQTVLEMVENQSKRDEFRGKTS